MSLEMFGLDEPLPDTPDVAALEIDAIMGNQEHPYHHTFHADSGTTLRSRAHERVEKLFEIRSKDKKYVHDPIREACEEGQVEFDAREAAKQVKIEDDFSRASAELKSLGITEPFFTDGPTRPYHVRFLEQQVLLAAGNFGKLGSSLRDSFRTLSPSIDMQLLLSRFEELAVDGIGGDACLAIGQSLIDYVADRRTKLGR